MKVLALKMSLWRRITSSPFTPGEATVVVLPSSRKSSIVTKLAESLTQTFPWIVAVSPGYECSVTRLESEDPPRENVTPPYTPARRQPVSPG